MCHCHREQVKHTFTVEHSQLQINSPMTFSQVAAAEIPPRAFDLVKCIFPEVSHLIRYYDLFTDVSTQIAGALSFTLEEDAQCSA